MEIKCPVSKIRRILNMRLKGDPVDLCGTWGRRNSNAEESEKEKP